MDELSTIESLEKIRWPNGVSCLRCSSGRIRRLVCKGKHGRRRHLYWCAGCEYEFSIMVGTIFQGSHLPLPKWFQAISLMCSKREGVSAMHLSRELLVCYESAWSVARRIRRALDSDPEWCQQIADAHQAAIASRNPGASSLGSEARA